VFLENADVADTEDLSMEWAGLQLEMLLQAMVTLKVSFAHDPCDRNAAT
jgi:hypothetical protein